MSESTSHEISLTVIEPAARFGRKPSGCGAVSTDKVAGHVGRERRFLRTLLLPLLVVALVLSWMPAYSANGSGSDPTTDEQQKQKKIDELTKELAQSKQHEAELTKQLKEAESKAPAPAPDPTPEAAPTPAPPLTTTAMTGPLQFASPTTIDLSGFPLLSEVPVISDLLRFDVNGVVSGIGVVQSHNVSTDRTSRADVSNAQVMIQKADGVVQYYLQVGAYDIPAVGVPFVSSGNAVNLLYGPLPVAYVKIAPTGTFSNFSLLAGNLPTLIGAEYTFTFENVNIERGLLWNQENAINRGVQANYSLGPVSASISWNNGFYSDSYTWLWGLLSYAINSANTLTAVGGQNLGFSKRSNFVAPAVMNNSGIYNLIYTYSSAPWIVQPYFQWTYVPHNSNIGVFQSTSTLGGALLASYNISEYIFVAARGEYIGSTGRTSKGAANLLYGPGSEAWSLTLTPTFQYKQFFVRVEGSFVQAIGYTRGDVFGNQGNNPVQLRGLIETGLLF